jgi:hypothetical protein
VTPTDPKGRARNRADRPPLPDVDGAPEESLQDALAAREAGDRAEMRRLLCAIDRGGGLRALLRAAAALEAGDERELSALVERVRRDEPAWRWPLETAAALAGADAGRAERLRERAAALGAPRWGLAWARAVSPRAAERNEGLVELLFADASLARTVAARDVGIEGAVAEPQAAERYAALSHGRACIGRFGAALVADLLDRCAP